MNDDATIWLKKLKESCFPQERIKIAQDPLCPSFLIEIMVSHDVEIDVIQAGISNPNCPTHIILLGQERLLSIKEEKKKHSTLCPLMWNHLVVQQNGDLRQCCLMTKDPYGKYFDENGKSLNFNHLETARNHPEAKQTRKKMMEGERPAACKLCWDEEDIGIMSKRQSRLKKYDMKKMLANTSEDGTINDVPLTYLDLRLGNLCNLKCRSCGPTDSSMWVEDYAKSHLDDKVMMNYYGERQYEIKQTGKGWRIDSDDFEWYNNQSFHDWLDTKILNGLSIIYFTGGEPTINKTHMRILKRIIELDKASNMSLEYNTNMVAIPPNLLKMWNQFNNVQIGASIDAIGPLASYVRNPSKWEVIEKNCDRIGYGQFDKITIGLATTISVFNIRNFIDLTKWLISKKYTSFNNWPSWHLLLEPNCLNIQILPIDIKEEIKEEYNQFYKWIKERFDPKIAHNMISNYETIMIYMYQEQRQYLLSDLKDTVLTMDRIRNETIKTAIPWLSDILDTVK